MAADQVRVLTPSTAESTSYGHVSFRLKFSSQTVVQHILPFLSSLNVHRYIFVLIKRMCDRTLSRIPFRFAQTWDLNVLHNAYLV